VTQSHEVIGMRNAGSVKYHFMARSVDHEAIGEVHRKALGGLRLVRAVMRATMSEGCSQTRQGQARIKARRTPGSP
jgi:hypothetical protein